MTDAEKVSTLRSAIERADKALDWILEQPGHSEWMMTTASRVRRILRAAIKKIDPGTAPAKKKTRKQEADDHVDS